MASFNRQLTRIAAAVVIVATASGCARVGQHKGYLVDRLVVESIAPGVDNRESVQVALGLPTFTSQFGPEQWYYVARDVRSLAYRKPKPVDQTILRVSFDKAGNVVEAGRIGMEQVAHIDPAGGKTPTLGRKRTLFEDLFGGGPNGR